MEWLKLWLKVEVKTDGLCILKFFKATLFQKYYSLIYHIGV